MTPTTVINIKNGGEYDVFIGRPGIWGNPFVLGPDGGRLAVIEKFEDWIVQQEDLMAEIHQLKGKVLGCYCKPLKCHGDVLARLADAA